MTEHALLFTDVVDSTLIVERLGDARAAELWAEHDRRARRLLADHHGREIDRTDGFFLLFDDVTDAARYALAYQGAVAGLELGARVGLHVGRVTLRENDAQDVARGAKRFEVEGLAKPFAARVMALARGGQTLLSEAARAALGAALDLAATMESHGHYRLKGIEQPVEIFELGGRTGCAFAPPEDADKAYRVVRVDAIWRPVREVRHNLPVERDAFVGRTADLRALAARFDDGARLLTVLGPGGTGKTRFVRRYGWAWLGDWPGGVYFCDLSEARSLDGIFFAVAAALEIPLGKDDPGVQIGHAIAGRGHCLVILDNFEQVLAHASATIGHWLDRAGDARVVVTSRERLHLAGEEIVVLEPLPVADDAIELFRLRARAQRADFALGDSNHAAVAEVVRLLDGLPLAIELAAARVRVFSPAQLVERMRDRFALLAGVHGPASRQATLRAAIDWSWDLLAPWEQAALAQCSVFEGGFTLEAAEAVLDLSTWGEASLVMDAVQALVDKSLLRTWSAVKAGRFDLDEPYFGMYLSIHDYAVEKCIASGPQVQHEAEERHGEFFARFGIEDALERLCLHGGVRQRRALTVEIDNLVAACQRAVRCGRDAPAVAAYRAAWEVLEFQGPLALGVSLGAQVLAMSRMAPSLRCIALMTRALAAWRAGDAAQARASLEQALSHSRGIADLRREGIVLRHLGMLRNEQGQTAEARLHYDRALSIHRADGDRRQEGSVLGGLGILHSDQGRLEAARTCYDLALVILRDVGDRMAEGVLLGNLGGLHHELGHADEARMFCEQALDIHREGGDRRSEGIMLGNLAILHHDQGRLNEARSNHVAALAIHRELGNRRHEGIVLGNLGSLSSDQGLLEEARAYNIAALVIAREVGNRRQEGALFGNLGDLLMKQGRARDAREALRSGEELLRGVDDRLELAKLLGIRGRTEVALGDLEAAREALGEAEALAVAVGVGPDSDLSHEIAKLRQALA